MKKFLPVTLILCTFMLKAQTLTQVYNEPKVGDTDIEWLLDTSAYTTGLPLNVTGSNAVWNYTSLATSTLVNIAYVSPTTVPSSTAHVGCTVVQQDATNYTFIKSVTSPSTQTEIMGLDIGIGAVTLTNTAIAARYPITFGYSLTDNVSGSFTSSLTNGNCTGNIVTTADGQGTLNLPGGATYPNVLRVKSVLTLTLQAGIISLGTARQIIYSYYHSSQKFPLLGINYTILAFGAGNPSVNGSANGNGNIMVGLPEHGSTEEVNIGLYPNPAGGMLNINVSNDLEPKEIKIFNSLSELVYSSGYSNETNLGGLKPGVYFITIGTKSGIITRRFIKE